MIISLYIYLFAFMMVFCWGISSNFRFRLVSGSQIGFQKSSGGSKLIFLFLAVLLVAACILKPENIADYAEYQRLYNYNSLGLNYNERLEPTFLWIADISPTFLILIFIYALISIYLNLRVIQRYSCNVPVSLLLYLSPYFVLHDMIQIRAAVACALMLWAITYIPSRDWKRYFALITVAVLFHKSALIFAPIYFLSGTKLNKSFYSIVIIALLAAAAIHISVGLLIKYIPIPAVQVYYATYAFSYWKAAPSVGMVIFGKCVMALWMIRKIENIQSVFPYAIISLKIFIASIACFILFTDIPVMAGRLYEATGVIDIYAMAMFPLVAPKWKKLLVLLPIAFAFFRLPFSIALLTSTIEN